MDNSKRCLIAIDLDSTVLSSYFSLSADSVRALIEAQSAGHVVMIATARPEAMTLPYHRAMGFHGPMSTLNGAHLYHPDDPSFPVYEELVSPESTAAFSEIADRAGVKKIWLEQNRCVHAVSDPTPDFFYFREVFRQSGAAYHEKLPAVPAARIYACADTQEQADAIMEVMSAREDCSLRHHVTAAGEHRINCNAVTADKWFAVKRAADFYGIPNENVITFGDEVNDRRMILSASHGFVLRNGSKALQEEALAAGANVTELVCAEGGVGHEIRKLLF
ncbi:MAG: HAD-IIB family hydrolase [Clostridia bacterium]|nr:HAD-IIB family hydrolase [Clostridia bacterium]